LKKIKSIPAACAVFALCYVSEIDEDTVIRVCRLCGFEAGEGMTDFEWQEAAEHLKLKLTKVKMNPRKLKTFIKEHKRGLFLVCTKDHLFAVDF